jgi:large subunit ribosomal protein L7/L12
MSEEINKDSEVVVPEKFKSLVESISKMSVLDLAELVKILEKKFGVSAAAPAMMMAAAGPAAAVVEEKESFDVELTDAGANKISVIKALREVSPDLGLKEAKDLVDGAPKVIKEAVKKEDANNMKKKLEDAGGKVTLK